MRFAIAGALAALLVHTPALADPAARIRPQAEQMCRTAQFNIYFEREKTALSPAASATLDKIGRQLAGCAVNSVNLEADAADLGAPGGTHKAGARGAAVLGGLSARGVIPALVIVTASAVPQEQAAATPPHLTITIDAAPPAKALPGKPSYEV
jgi:outer membrane protein OmpA-like peptidoglycan-associated protein